MSTVGRESLAQPGESNRPPPVHVTVDPGGTVEAAVRSALAGGEAGLQVCAVRDGEVLVDVVGGSTDGVPVTPRSLFPVFSVTKGVAAAAALRLVADGVIGLDVPIIRVWPEFGRSGKGATTLRHVLTHTAGVPEMPEGCTVEQMCDWSGMVHYLEARAPTWAPGSTMAYHAYTFGWLVGELIRRVADGHESPGHYVRRVVAEAAGAEDFYIGLPPEHDERVVTLDDRALRADRVEGLRRRALPPELAPGQLVFGRPDVRAAELLGAGGIASARALARIYGSLAARSHGSDDWGRTIASGAHIAKDEFDQTSQVRVARGLGYFVGGGTNPASAFPFDPGSQTFGHSGAGGSLAWADRASATGFAITRSRLTPAGRNDPVVVSLAGALHSAVEEKAPSC